MSTVRHTRDDWLREGLEALVEEGYKALAPAQLAKRLGVTKGSFYWHFQSVARFHDALLEYWHKQLISVAPRDARQSPAPATRLGELLMQRGLPRYDAAIRKWARHEAKAARAIEKSDQFRRRRLNDLLVRQGVSQARAELLAQLVIWAWKGSADEPNLRWRAKVMSVLFEQGSS